MATRADLRTRLKRRLGLGVVSDVETARLNEALQSGLYRALIDGIPGIAYDVYTASVAGEVALSTVTGTESNTTLNLSGDGISSQTEREHNSPQDIVVCDESGTVTKFLIRKMGPAISQIDTGYPLERAYSGGSDSKLIRRSIPLPTTGQVTAIYRGSGQRRNMLQFDPMLARRDPFATGTPEFFEQRYDDFNARSFVSLWPAPTETERFTVVQMESDYQMSDDAHDLNWPEAALDAILERARMAWLTWCGTANQIKASMAISAVNDTADALSNTANTKQIYTKT